MLGSQTCKCPDVLLDENRNTTLFRTVRISPGELPEVVCEGGGFLSYYSTNVVYSLRKSEISTWMGERDFE
jgi:hypothetical protein